VTSVTPSTHSVRHRDVTHSVNRAAVNPYARGRGINESIPPHRSYRSLPFSSKALLSSLPGLLIVELLVFFFGGRALDLMSNFALLVARDQGVGVRSFADPFLWVTMHPITFDIRHSDWIELLIVIIVCAAIVIGLSLWTAIAAPLRYFINFNALLVGGAALFLFLTGHVNYDSAAFSQLMLRTALLTWLVIPVLVAFFASLFPFRVIERWMLILVVVAWDVPLSIARYACFIAILGKTGTIAMTDLYFVFGPLLDIIPVICFLSAYLVRLARSLEARRAAWGL
jgi:hypothetical protein